MSLIPTDLAVDECHYCSTIALMTRDHIVPASLGGPDGGWNIVKACPRCNYEKADKWPTCGCEKCVAAVERFLEDPRLTERASVIVRRRKRELGDQLASIERAHNKIKARVENFDTILALLNPGP